MRDEAAPSASTGTAPGAAIAAVVAGGGTAAFATIGDPNLYSTFAYVAQTVRALVPDVTVETVPGITAMQDLAARSGTVLAEGDERLALVPYTAGDDRAARRARRLRHRRRLQGRAPPAATCSTRCATPGACDAAVYGEQLGRDGETRRPAAERDGRGAVHVDRDRAAAPAGRGSRLGGARL